MWSALVGCSASDSSNSSADVDRTSSATVEGDAENANHVPDPIVTPAPAGDASPGLRYDVTQFGYQEQEYFFEGTARTYPPLNLPRAPYRSRMTVWTPTDPARFNGTTVVEWAHVSDYGQFELTIELNYETPMLEEEGFAFVLVSVEEGGVCDQGPSGCTGTSLKGANPERYGSLNHPGDAYSFDMFSQAMQAIKRPTAIAPLGELGSTVVVAEGFQPSIDKWFPLGAPDPASFTSPFSIYGPLNAYLASGADDDAQLADAFLIDAAAPAVEPAQYRVPTLHHLDESAIRRTQVSDSPNHVTWEVVGAPHADRWTADHFRLPTNTSPKLGRQEEEARREEFDEFGQNGAPGGTTCAPGRTTGSMFPRRFTLNAALVALRDWIETGDPAPASPRIERTESPPESPMNKLRRDLDGNALGGLRSPIVQVPAATYNGEACVEAGTTIPLASSQLAERYPNHESYVRQLLAATDDAVSDRFLLCHDAETIMRKASASTIGGTEEFTASPECAQRANGIAD